MFSPSKYLLIYCVPKPWTKEFAPIQQLAIESWKKLASIDKNISVHITILGNEEGNVEYAKKLGVSIYPGELKLNEWGTPLVSDIFDIIANTTPLIADVDVISCYINSDIVLYDDFIHTIAAVEEKQFLLIGERTDVDYTDTLTLDNIKDHTIKTGMKHGPSGIDYFVFSSMLFKFVYPFALGKFVWDQWLVGNAYRRGVTVIDCTGTILATHLNSNWYFRGGATNDRESIHSSEEGTRNRGFDYYQKTISTGSTHKFVFDEEQTIKLIKNAFL